jgi:two-component system, cell cycle sensor histidine kinase and response regulator CckA
VTAGEVGVGAAFAGFLEVIPDAIIGVGNDGGILFSNSQAASLFGYQRDELRGRPVELLMLGSLRKALYAQRTSAVRDPLSGLTQAVMEPAAQAVQGAGAAGARPSGPRRVTTPATRRWLP